MPAVHYGVEQIGQLLALLVPHEQGMVSNAIFRNACSASAGEIGGNRDVLSAGVSRCRTCSGSSSSLLLANTPLAMSVLPGAAPTPAPEVPPFLLYLGLRILGED